MDNKQIKTIFDYLATHYPDARTELNRHTPFQLLVAVILSAQTTDKQVNKVTARLRKNITHPQHIVNRWEKKFNHAIKSIGLHNNKAKHIYQLSLILTNQTYIKKIKKEPLADKAHEIYHQYWYYIPSNLEQLQKLPGIGIKTAKVLWHILYDLPVIAVDTHVHRVANRLWLVQTKTAGQTDKELEKTIAHKYRKIAHHGLILFGRYHCTARTPICSDCPFTSFCLYYKRIKGQGQNC